MSIKRGDQRYLGVPPFQQHSKTSEAASVSMTEHAPNQRERVLLFLRERGEEGSTRDEIAVCLEMSPKAVDPRVAELIARNLIRETARKRPTRSGRDAAVLMAVAQDAGASQAQLLDAPAKRVYH